MALNAAGDRAYYIFRPWQDIGSCPWPVCGMENKTGTFVNHGHIIGFGVCADHLWPADRDPFWFAGPCVCGGGLASICLAPIGRDLFRSPRFEGPASHPAGAGGSGPPRPAFDRATSGA